ncbi:hypothetical protein VTJ49DRAFT_5512 [Mycothermus thermophilus]|uniref:AB hydrolase-1 domain-containing protein n=1 Tax=Humicola insolens TaxID=85995 RepID=A0ABR3VKL5_HUMIN
MNILRLLSLLPSLTVLAHNHPPTTTTGTILTTDNIHLNYTQSGPLHGRNIVFIPGWRQTASEWQKQATYFSQSGFRVTTYDMRGHGDSDKPSFGYRLSRFAADLNDLLDQLKLTDVAIVGHSMGCSVAWAWWDQYNLVTKPKPGKHGHGNSPRRVVSSLMLVDQPAVMVRNPAWSDEYAARVGAIFEPQGIYDMANDIGAQLPSMLRGMFTTEVTEEEYQWVLAQNLKMSDENGAALLIDHGLADWRDVLPRIDVPTLVIAGDVSVFPVEGVRWVAEQIPGAEEYTFGQEERGSHFMFWENPERFNEVVKDFLTRGSV